MLAVNKLKAHRTVNDFLFRHEIKLLVALF